MNNVKKIIPMTIEEREVIYDLLGKYQEAKQAESDARCQVVLKMDAIMESRGIKKQDLSFFAHSWPLDDYIVVYGH